MQMWALCGLLLQQSPDSGWTPAQSEVFCIFSWLFPAGSGLPRWHLTSDFGLWLAARGNYLGYHVASATEGSAGLWTDLNGRMRRIEYLTFRLICQFAFFLVGASPSPTQHSTGHFDAQEEP